MPALNYGGERFTITEKEAADLPNVIGSHARQGGGWIELEDGRTRVLITAGVPTWISGIGVEPASSSPTAVFR